MQAQVKEFHRLLEEKQDPRKPTVPSEEVKDLRLRLINEEFKELRHAFYDNDIVEIADALGDLLYVVYGTAISCGIEMESVFDEIHRSNMAKLWPDGKPHYNEYGKVLKPEGWQKPDIASILDLQRRLMAAMEKWKDKDFVIVEDIPNLERANGKTE